jgi:hypothetical protein
MDNLTAVQAALERKFAEPQKKNKNERDRASLKCRRSTAPLVLG